MLERGFPAEADLFNPQNLVFSFPQKGPHDAVMRDDMSAIEQLEHWKMMQLHYCEHKPSITVYVREHEWMAVGAWVYENFNIMSGVSFLPYSGGVYAQAPYQEITEEEYNEWMKRVPHEVDFDTYTEVEDNTEGSQTLACTGGVCEI
jgi:ribonucleoside-diphosphate reductase alpha chain